MRRTFFTAAAALCLAACNSSSGPERTTPAEFGDVTFSPTEVTADTEVTVEASITSEYGFRRVDIVYILDDDESDVRFASLLRSFEAEAKSLSYKGIIPGQKAGRKVTFWVRAITAYDVVTLSDPRSYTIPKEEEDEKPEQPNLTMQ